MQIRSDRHMAASLSPLIPSFDSRAFNNGAGRLWRQIAAFLFVLTLLLAPNAPFTALHAQDGVTPLDIVPAPNPTLGAACGIDTLLVLDESGSIRDADAIEPVRNATRAFLSGLSDTGSHVGLVEFASTARHPLDYAPVTAGAGGTINGIFEPYLVNDYDPPGSPLWYTNWNDAMKKVMLASETRRADLVVFVTDGDPTAYNKEHPDAPTDATIDDVVVNTISDGPALTQTVEFADQVKNGGTRILVVGVGGALSSPESQERLQAISGLNVYDGAGELDIQNDDVMLVQDFADLEQTLREVAFALCGSSLTVNKMVQETNGETASASGWPFSANVTVDSSGGPLDFVWLLPDATTPANQAARGTTDASDALIFQWKPNANSKSTIIMRETVQSGFRFIDAACTVRSLDNPTPRPLAVTVQDAGFRAEMGPTDIATCDVLNARISAGIAVGITPAHQLLRRGQTAKFNLAVTNATDEPLANVMVHSSHCGDPAYTEGDVNGDNLLQVAETWRYICQAPDVQADFTNEVTAVGEDVAGQPVDQARAQATVEVMSPEIAVEMTPAVQYVEHGGTATIQVDVSNPGDVALSNVAVSGDQCTALVYVSGDANDDQILQPDEVWTYECAVENVITDVVNTSTATADDPNGEPLDPAQDTAEVKVRLDNICQTAGFTGAPLRTKIIGAGVGEQYGADLPRTLDIPQADNLTALYAQLTGKWRGALPHAVTFETPRERIHMTEPTSLGDHEKYKMYTYETALQPVDRVTLGVDDHVVNKYHTPRGFVLYATYESGSDYFELVRQINTFVNWKMDVTEHTERIAIPPLAEARSVYVAAVISDNRNDDDRPLILTAAAGGVSARTIHESPNRGSQLDIIYLKLPQVPAGTDEVTLALESPDEEGDSIGLAGYSVNFPCTPDSDDDGVPDAEEDLDGNGDLANDDTDGDGRPNYLDADDDGDDTASAEEDANGDFDPLNDDSDGNGIPDFLDGDGSVAPPTPSAIADLAVSKTAISGTETVAGTPLDYRIQVVNHGPDAADNVEIEDLLPSGVTLGSAAIVTNSTAADGAPARNCTVLTNIDGSLLCSLGTLGSGESVTIDVQVQSDPALAAGSILTNTAEATTSASDPNSDNNRAMARTTVRTLPTLFIEQTVSDTAPAAGERVLFAVRVRNGGPSVARNVVVHVALPPEVQFIESSADCALVEELPGQNYTCAVVDLAVDQTAVVEIAGEVSADAACGPASSSVARVTADAMQGEAFATVDVTTGCLADLQAHKFSSTDGALTAGVPVTLTFMAENLGSDVAHHVVISGALEIDGPYDIRHVDANPFGDRAHAHCDVVAAFNILQPRQPFTCVLDEQLETLDLDTGGGRWLVRMVVSSAADQIVQTQAHVSSHTADPDLSNNTIAADSDPAILASVTAPPDSDGDGIPDYADSDAGTIPDDGADEDKSVASDTASDADLWPRMPSNISAPAIPILLGTPTILHDANADVVRVTLGWQTNREENVAGFRVWRRDESGVRVSDAAGPEGASQVTPALIPARGVGSTYSVADTLSAVPEGESIVYTYWVEEVEQDGATVVHAPIRVTVGSLDHPIFLPVITR